MGEPTRILMVDDEAGIRQTLGALLQRIGYLVTPASCGEEAVVFLDEQTFDLMLVDLKMPGMDGMQVVTAARHLQPDIAIIVLTGHGSLETAIEGMHQGVFDYLLKTTEPAQVIERVNCALAARAQQLRQRALLEVVDSSIQELRGGGRLTARDHTSVAAPPTRIITVGALQLDTWRQRAMLKDAMLALTPTEFRVLLCLAEHVDTMLLYSQLVRCAQGYEANEIEAGELIKPHIHHLRQKIEPNPSTPRYILNVRGKGYLLASHPAIDE